MTLYIQFHETYGDYPNILEIGDHPSQRKTERKYLIENGIRHTTIDRAGKNINQARKYTHNPYCQRCKDKLQTNTPLYTTAKGRHKVNPEKEIVLCHNCWQKQKTAQAL